MDARRPGDLFLDRYLKDADVRTRERAREAFREFGRVLEALGEAVSGNISDSREFPNRDRIPTIPTDKR